MSSILPFFMIDSFPRSGSTSLARAMGAYPGINCCIEPFHPSRYGGEFNKLAMTNGGVKMASSLIRARWNSFKHVWDPTNGWPFARAGGVNDELCRHVEAIVVLRRRNLLQQLVSGYISKHLQFWIGSREEFLSRLNRAIIPAIDPLVVEIGLKQMIEHQSRRDELLARLDVRTIRVAYEELFSVAALDRFAKFNLILTELDQQEVSRENFEELYGHFFSPALKWADAYTYGSVPGLLTIEDRFGSDETGWLFKQF